jgi:hypothetical protein
MRVAVLAGLLSLSLVGSARSQPFGGDDDGFIPPDAPNGPIAKCETAVAKLAGKLGAAWLKCAVGTIKSGTTTIDESCETAAFEKYQNATAKLTGCPACIDFFGIAFNLEIMIDSFGFNGPPSASLHSQIFCAS